MCADDLFEKYLFYIVISLFLIYIIHAKTEMLKPDNLKTYYDLIIKSNYIYIFYMILILFIITLPKLPNKYNMIHDNIIYDLMMLSLVVYFSDKNMTIAILLSILYVSQKNSINDKSEIIIDDTNRNIDNTNNLLCGLNKRLINLETNNNYYDVNVHKSYNMSNNDILIDVNNKEKTNLHNNFKLKNNYKLENEYELSPYDKLKNSISQTNDELYSLFNNSINNQVNTPLNNISNNLIDNQFNNQVNTPLNNISNNLIDNQQNTPLNVQVNTPLNNISNNLIDNQQNTPLNVQVNTPLNNISKQPRNNLFMGSNSRDY